MKGIAHPVIENQISEILANYSLDPNANIAFQAFDILRDLIVNVQIKPGQRLSENEIAGALKTSKTPIREALIRLDEISLVKIVPQSGTYVRKICIQRFVTASFIRLNLEVGAIRIAATSPDPMQSMDVLDDILAQQKRALDDGDRDFLFASDDRFHRFLFVLAGHLDAWNVSRRSQFDLNRVRMLRRQMGQIQGQLTVRDHQEIVDAVKAQCPERAEARLRRHLGNLHRHINPLLQDASLRGMLDVSSGFEFQHE